MTLLDAVTVSFFLALAARGVSAEGISATPHDKYSSSIGVLGCKVNTNRIAYWPQSVDCNNICVKVSYSGRSVHLLRIDQSGGAYDISYDAWNYLLTGSSATVDPQSGGGIAMEYEDVDASECADLIHTDGSKLPLSASNSMNFLTSCLADESSWVGKNHVLYNICDSICSLGYDEQCTLDLSVSTQASCPHTLGLTTELTSTPVYNINYGTGTAENAATGAKVSASAAVSGNDDSSSDSSSDSKAASSSSSAAATFTSQVAALPSSTTTTEATTPAATSTRSPAVFVATSETLSSAAPTTLATLTTPTTHGTSSTSSTSETSLTRPTSSTSLTSFTSAISSTSSTSSAAAATTTSSSSSSPSSSSSSSSSFSSSPGSVRTTLKTTTSSTTHSAAETTTRASTTLAVSTLPSSKPTSTSASATSSRTSSSTGSSASATSSSPSTSGASAASGVSLSMAAILLGVVTALLS